MHTRDRLLAVGAVVCLVACAHTADELELTISPEPRAQMAPPPGATATVTPAATPPSATVPPREAADAASRGIAWLVEHQLPSGGWGQGDESTEMGGGEQLRDVANVADTCMAALALVRSGSTPSRGPHRDNVRRAAEFVISSIERSDQRSLSVTDVRGTRVQVKIGEYVDTFTSLNLLNELRNEMPNAREEARLRAALAKVVRKIERNQAANGTWAQQGWAPTLSESLAARGLNREARAGAVVDRQVLRRMDRRASEVLNPWSGGGPPTGGGANVELYDRAGAASALGESAATDAHKNGKQAREGSEVATRARTARRELVARLRDPSFVSGFGSNGGEEFLSYMLISETLSAEGGEEWRDWHASITRLLGGVQNNDGSWSGHHCITGRTFCTATALLVLLSDRAPARRRAGR